MKMNVDIAERLMRKRKEHGYSQEELAQKLGVSRQAVSKWERSESSPDTDNLIALAELYGVSLDDLIYVDDAHASEGVQLDGASDAADAPSPAGGGAPRDREDAGGDADDEPKSAASTFPVAILAVIVYLAAGFLWDAWAIAWVVFLVIPAYDSVVKGVQEKRTEYIVISVYTIAVIVWFIYMACIGQAHPAWIILLTIPIVDWLAHVLMNRKRD